VHPTEHPHNIPPPPRELPQHNPTSSFYTPIALTHRIQYTQNSHPQHTPTHSIYPKYTPTSNTYTTHTQHTSTAHFHITHGPHTVSGCGYVVCVWNVMCAVEVCCGCFFFRPDAARFLSNFFLINQVVRIKWSSHFFPGLALPSNACKLFLNSNALFKWSRNDQKMIANDQKWSQMIILIFIKTPSLRKILQFYFRFNQKLLCHYFEKSWFLRQLLPLGGGVRCLQLILSPSGVGMCTRVHWFRVLQPHMPNIFRSPKYKFWRNWPTCQLEKNLKWLKNQYFFFNLTKTSFSKVVSAFKAQKTFSK